MNTENSPPNQSDELDLEDMQTQQLEQILVDLLTVKYPGVEQADIERFFHALDRGNIEQIEQTEADIAEKSALWQRAALDLDEPGDLSHSGRSR